MKHWKKICAQLWKLWTMVYNPLIIFLYFLKCYWACPQPSTTIHNYLCVFVRHKQYLLNKISHIIIVFSPHCLLSVSSSLHVIVFMVDFASPSRCWLCVHRQRWLCIDEHHSSLGLEILHFDDFIYSMKLQTQLMISKDSEGFGVRNWSFGHMDIARPLQLTYSQTYIIIPFSVTAHAAYNTFDVLEDISDRFPRVFQKFCHLGYPQKRLSLSIFRHFLYLFHTDTIPIQTTFWHF
jgi:hypothetical protein